MMMRSGAPAALRSIVMPPIRVGCGAVLSLEGKFGGSRQMQVPVRTPFTHEVRQTMLMHPHGEIGTVTERTGAPSCSSRFWPGR